MGSIPDFLHMGRSIVTSVFIETGTFRGETLERACAAGFERLYSIEVVESHYATAREMFKDRPEVTLLLGSSPKVLPAILDRARPTTFWLDAHYQDAAPDEIDADAGECPLLAELAAIFAAPWAVPPIVLIDDAHMFTGTVPAGFLADQWPTLGQIAQAFPNDYSLDVSNGIIYGMTGGGTMPDDNATERVVRHPQGLVWYPERGYGFYQVAPNGQYGAAYWDNYQRYRESPIAQKLMRARVELVEAFVPGEPVVDIGIGSGHFVEERGYGEASPTFGYDVNPLAVAWLKERQLWRDPYETPVDAACCWDSIEHMENPEAFLKRVRQWIFLSIPIFDGPEHVLRSKHFKPEEHYWYFTRTGLVAWMRGLGWRLVAENRMETELGREDIGTFVFRRVQ